MERRLEIIVAILRWLASQPEPAAEIPRTLAACPDVSPSIIRYHIELCEEAGYIRILSNMKNWHRLTWAGHNEIDKG